MSTDKSAALLAKSTAEAATKLALQTAEAAQQLAQQSAVVQTNIEYIKRDIAEIKDTMKDIVSKYVTHAAFAENEERDNKQDIKIQKNSEDIVGLTTTIKVLGSVAVVFLTALQIILKFYVK